jgi:hypothetical protein
VFGQQAELAIRKELAPIRVSARISPFTRDKHLKYTRVILTFRHRGTAAGRGALAAEKRTLEMFAGGARLEDILENLCDTIDAQA